MRPLLSICAVLLASGATLFAQQANFSTFGNGCGVYGEPPRPATIWGTGLPRLGASVTVGFTGPTFGGATFWPGPFLLTGLSRTSIYGVPLPYHLPFQWMGGPDCYLYCSSEVLLPPWSQFVIGRVTMTIPMDPRMLGMPVYQQWYISYIVLGQWNINFTLTTDCGVWTIGL